MKRMKMIVLIPALVLNGKKQPSFLFE